MPPNKLTPQEAAILINKGTEAPFSGKYCHHKQAGTYICRQCDTPLYTSDAKFDSGCGWPSFDQEIDKNVVKRIPDPDGRRTEIVCAQCDGHLGHVFSGEGMTPKNTRHCVNSLSLAFEPTISPSKHETAYFGGGCFWGMEYYFQQQPGVLQVVSGFMGGNDDHPSYQQVCTGETGHIEVIEVHFDPQKTNYEALCTLFFEIHDPSQANRQGPDVGSQYRSALFFTNEQQPQVALKLINRLKTKGLAITTQQKPASPFWPADEKHQNYYQKNGQQPYCHFPTPRFEKDLP